MDIRTFIAIVESAGAEYDEYALYKKGEEDGRTGKADWSFLDSSFDERPYWQGFKDGKSQIPLPSIAGELREHAPSSISAAISDADLDAAYGHLIKGHSLDNVENYAARDHEDALWQMAAALAQLASVFDQGRATLYRVIGVDGDIDLSSPTHVGIFWSYCSDWTMSQADDVTTVEMEGQVLPSAVDWSETIPLTIDAHEGEIRLLQGATISNFSASVTGPVSSEQLA